MKLTITNELPKIDIFGSEAIELWQDKRKVYIDEKEVPTSLAKIILLGFDVATQQYLDLVEAAMREESLVDRNLK